MIVDIDDAPLKRRRGRPPRLPAEWEAAFLEHYASKGNIHTAAKVAGVSVNTVAKHRRASAPFRARMRLAYREYGALLRETLGQLGIDKGNVIALLASLKGHSERLARRYSEKAVDARILNLKVNTYAPASLADPAAFLRACLADITPATRAELLSLGERSEPPPEAIVDGEIVASEPPGATQAP